MGGKEGGGRERDIYIFLYLSGRRAAEIDGCYLDGALMVFACAFHAIA